MNHAGNILGKTLLHQTQMGSGVMLGNKGLTLVLLYIGEYLYVTLGILVTYIQPELVELVGRCVLGVEPYVSVVMFPHWSAPPIWSLQFLCSFR